MAKNELAGRGSGEESDPRAPGISWEPGEEDYPFAALPGESALDYFGRWLEGSGYARIERDGIRYIHEEDIANVVNHITADVALLRARLGPFGDKVVTAETYGQAIERIEQAVAYLGMALDTLRNPAG